MSKSRRETSRMLREMLETIRDLRRYLEPRAGAVHRVKVLMRSAHVRIPLPHRDKGAPEPAPGFGKFGQGVRSAQAVLDESAAKLGRVTAAADDEQAMRARKEARDNVSDEELIARMNAAPDMGGALLVELSEFMERKATK